LIKLTLAREKTVCKEDKLLSTALEDSRRLFLILLQVAIIQDGFLVIQKSSYYVRKPAVRAEIYSIIQDGFLVIQKR